MVVSYPDFKPLTSSKASATINFPSIPTLSSLFHIAVSNLLVKSSNILLVPAVTGKLGPQHL